MNSENNSQYINKFWDQAIIPTLMEYIKIPNKSPMFDPNWQAHGHMDRAVNLIANWCQQHAVENMQLEIVRLPGRTPLIFIDIPGDVEKTVLLYGHLDKQPEMSGWDADLEPWKPVMKGDRLYGRGSADDGYAAFASLAAIKALRAQNIPHARCVILIEASEESGSSDLPYYIQALENRIGTPELIICLDSGCGNYEQLWMTTSLRGLVSGILQIDVLQQGIHSGLGSGIVPSCFMVLRQLLDRLEDANTGTIRLADLFVEIPEARSKQAEQAAQVLKNDFLKSIPLQLGVSPVAKKLNELLLNRTWRPALSVIGSQGLPMIENAGNVTLPSLSVKLSMRLPPTLSAESAAQHIKKCLETNPPFGAKVQFNVLENASGWNAPAEATWLREAAQIASQHYFGQPCMYLGEGGSIPFMGMLGKKFPEAQFVITGVLGPESNAHGPNEFLHIPTGKKVTCCVAEIVARLSSTTLLSS